MFYVIFYSTVIAFIVAILVMCRKSGPKHLDHLVYLLDRVNESLCFLHDNLPRLSPENALSHKELLIGFRIEMRACELRLNELREEARKERRIRPTVGKHLIRYRKVHFTLRSIDQQLKVMMNGAAP